jgi:tRNA threonylcarbamoyladenosine biosynthesis protein TsaB
MEREPYILSIDTATDMRSVAVCAGLRVLAQTTGKLRSAQAANLLGDIDAALANAGLRLDQIKLLACARGPGSFTGLRAGLATMKAFAATLDKPLVGVPTLHAIARSAGVAPYIVAALPAGRGELFAQLLGCAADGMITTLNEPAHLPPHVLVERARNWPTPLRWAGSGAHTRAELIGEMATRAGIEWRVEDEEHNTRVNNFKLQAIEPVGARAWSLVPPADAYAAEIAALALCEYQSGRTLPAEEVRALYVRLSDAELNERCRV